MLIALDPYTLRDSMPLREIMETARRIGFEAIEISPRDDFFPWWTAPRSQRPRSGGRSTRSFPSSRPKASKMAFEAHPNELHRRRLRGGRPDPLDRPSADSYVLCAPHTFSLLGGPTQLGMPGAPTGPAEVARLIRHSADITTEVHIADALNPFRVIVSPPGAPVRIHQHLDIGRGDIDWETYLSTLRDVGFDGIFTLAIFSHPDWTIESDEANLAELRRRLVAVGYEV